MHIFILLDFPRTLVALGTKLRDGVCEYFAEPVDGCLIDHSPGDLLIDSSTLYSD